MATPHGASVRGASILILIQLVSRGLTFVVNQILLGYISPELLGAATQYELFSISVLYFARESLQVALLRQTSSTQAAVNVSYFALALGMPLAYLLSSFWASSNLPNVSFASESLKWYSIASLVELCCEPCFTIAQLTLAYRVRAVAQTSATIARCLVSLAVFHWAHRQQRDLGALPFAYGQLCYAIVLLVAYIGQSFSLAKRHKVSLVPRMLQPTANDVFFLCYFSRNSCLLALNMYVQTAIKYILTQGDSLVIASVMSLRDQGTYALASNYGALVARTLFQPIEESSRSLYARLCSPSGKTADQSHKDMAQASQSLQDVFRAYNLLALLSWSLGPSVAPKLLNMLTGQRWSTTGAGDVLGKYCYYIPLLALNGVSEAFVAAVASSAELRTQSILMTGYSFGFAGAAYVFLEILDLGPSGLIWSNCVNMSLRIMWNLWFIRRYFRAQSMEFRYSKTLPSALSVGLAICAAAVLWREPTLSPNSALLEDIVLSGTVCGGLALSLLISERFYFTRMLLPLLQRQVSQSKRSNAS